MFYYSLFVLIFFWNLISSDSSEGKVFVIRFDNTNDGQLLKDPRILLLENSPFEPSKESDGNEHLIAWLQNEPCGTENSSAEKSPKLYDYTICPIEENLLNSLISKFPKLLEIPGGYLNILASKYALLQQNEIDPYIMLCDGTDECKNMIKLLYKLNNLNINEAAYFVPKNTSCSDVADSEMIHSSSLTFSGSNNKSFASDKLYDFLKSEQKDVVLRATIDMDFVEKNVCGCDESIEDCTFPDQFNRQLGRMLIPLNRAPFSNKAAPSLDRQLQNESDLNISDSSFSLSNITFSNISTTTSTAIPNLFERGCTLDVQCMNGQGICQNGVCRGFQPDLDATRIFQCPQNFRCEFTVNSLPGLNIDSTFAVMAIPPTRICGDTDALDASDSVFKTENIWRCADNSPESCVFSAGVPQLTNFNDARQGVRLCGCPNIDSNENRISCDMRRDFFVNLGLVVVQECFMNAHCAHKQFAQCVDGKCANGDGLFAGTSLKMFKCVTSQNCNIRAITQRAIGEALKVIEVSDSNECGSDIGLSPEALTDSMLPCVLDVDDDGVCEINLGIPHKIGRTRLCACSGDKGNNGINCDQPEDFDNLFGYVNVDECVVDSDCPANAMCISTKCVSDTKPPTIISTYPENEASIIPPINKVTVTWNENVVFTNSGNQIILECLNCVKQWRAQLAVYDTKNYKISQTGYSVTINNRDMEIIPNISANSFPEGKYSLTIPSNIVADIAGNVNEDIEPVHFSISKTADCPLLYVTGFYVGDALINGLYTSIDTINKHPAWLGGARSNYYIYWNDFSEEHPGTWVISTNREKNYVRAYLDPEAMKEKDISYRPLSGTWRKWNENRWDVHQNIIIYCTNAVDRLSPQLKHITPLPNSFSFPAENGEIHLFFNEPVQYGQWNPLTLTSLNTANPHVINLYSDYEKGMRNKYIFSDGSPEVKILVPEPLQPGESYEITTGAGFLTDLAYNPWGAVGPGKLRFTVFGISCPPLQTALPDLAWDRFLVLHSNNSHEGETELKCRDPYTLFWTSGDHSPNESKIVTTCYNGEWSTINAQCMAPCEKLSLTLSTDVYDVQREKALNPHGTQIEISCRPESVVMRGNGKAVTTCNDGTWTVSDLVCVASCGKFPLLGPAYDVEYAVENLSALSTILGSRRTVRCSSAAELYSGISPAVVVCEERGWSPLNLECHISCPVPLTYDEGYQTTSISTYHGSVYTVSCSPGYTGFVQNTPVQSVNVQCNDGKWEQQTSFHCFKDCEPFDSKLAYNVEPVTGIPGKHKSQIRISCSPYSLRVNDGLESEVITCNYGKWSLNKLTCLSSCEAPVSPKNRNAYDYFIPKSNYSLESMKLVDDRIIYGHRTKGYLMCSPGATIEEKVPPEKIICYNGGWYQANLVLPIMFETSTPNLVPPGLKCSAPCSNFSKDLRKYTTITPQLPNSFDTSIDTSNSNWLVPSGTIGTMRCNDNYSSPKVEGRFVCQKGVWVDEKPEDPFECMKSCSDYDILTLISQKHLEISGYNNQPLKHGETLTAYCQSPATFYPHTRPFEIVITCVNGILQVPTGKRCVLPTCTDNIKNGEEIAVDCGGPECRPCTDCDLGLPGCVASCNDGIKNNGELGVDCGGPCQDCQTCSKMPTKISAAMRVSLNEGQTWMNATENLRLPAAFPGSTMFSACQSPTKHSGSLLHVYTCSSQGQWNLTKFDTYLIQCLSESCDDGILSLGEQDVDCGGKCPKCANCMDGIRNGSEEGVDCGGPSCLPCSSCRTTLFKQFTLDLQVTTSENEPTDLSQMENIPHNSELTLSCAGDPQNTTVVVRCQDGRIESFPFLENALFHLPCHKIHESSSVVPIKTANVIQLPKPASCDEDVSCCLFTQEFNSIMSSECGALLYGNKTNQIEGFCAGKCYSQLYEILFNKYEITEDTPAASCLRFYVPLARKLMKQFCVVENGEYCFASVQDTLNKLNNIAELPEAQMQNMCAPKTCFQQNLDYFDILNELAFKTKNWTTSKENKNSRFEVNMLFNSGFSVQQASPRSEGNDTKEALIRANKNKFLYHQLRNPDLRNWFRNSRYSKRLSDLICLRDASNKLCAPITAKLINYVTTESSDITVAQNSFFGLAQVCSEPCYNIIFRHLGQTLINEGVTANRVNPYQTLLGVMIRNYGRVSCQFTTNSNSCSDIFGVAVKSASQPLQLFSTADKNTIYAQCNSDPNVPTCPLSFIGDGQCDPECFRPECGFDENDCTFENMFPITYQRLTSKMSLNDPCHPFHNSFNCNNFPTGPANCREKVKGIIMDEGCCAASRWDFLREVLRYNVELRSLYLNPSLLPALAPSEMMYPSLNLDRSPFWIEASCNVALDRTCATGIKQSIVQAQYKLVNMNYSDLFYDNLRHLSNTVLTKAIREAMSNLLAIPRYDITEIRFWPGSVSIEIVIDAGLQAVEILEELKSLRYKKVVKNTLRETIEKAIKYINKMRQEAKRQSRQLQELSLSDDVSLEEDAIIEEFDFQISSIQKPEVSLDIKPEIPLIGTLDMDNLELQLRKPMCSYEISLSVNNEAYIITDDPSTESWMSENPYGVVPFTPENPPVLKDGFIRSIQCAPGYEQAEFQSGPSPQLLICDRGRWSPANLTESLLICEKSCPPYEEEDVELDTVSMTVIKEGSNRHLSRRRILCNAGYESTSIPKGIEILTCRSGVWDRRTLECIRKDLTSQLYKTAECGDTKIMNILDNPETYILKEIVSKTLAETPENTESIDKKKIYTYIGIWSLKCARGYISETTVMPLVCVNTTLFTYPIPFDLTVHNYENFQNETLELYKASRELEAIGNNSSELLAITEIRKGETTQLLQCKPDVREPPYISPSQPGMSNAAFYVLVFTGCCGILVVGMLLLYLKKTHCCRKSFFNDKHYNNKLMAFDNDPTPIDSKENVKPGVFGYGDTNSLVNSNFTPKHLITPDSSAKNRIKLKSYLRNKTPQLMYLDPIKQTSTLQNFDTFSDVAEDLETFENTFYQSKPNKTLLKLANRKNKLEISPEQSRLAYTYERNLNSEFSGTESMQSAFYYSELDIDKEKLKRYWQFDPKLQRQTFQKSG